MKLKISEDLTLPVEAVTQTFSILAKRGAGKSYTGCVMVEEMLSCGQQVVIADPIGVWWGLRSSADGKSPGFPIVVFGGEHGDLPLEEHAGEIVAQSIVENGFSAVLDLSLFRKAAQVRFMTAFAETLYRLNRKPLHFMVDEADEFAPQRPMHGAERLLGAFEDIVRRGRARGVGVTLITQRAAVLNKNVLTQIEVLVVLRTISPQDRAAIEAWTEIHGTPKQLQQLSETMASLPIGTAWFWSPGWLDIFKKIVVRKKTTFDSSATPKVGETITKPKALAEVNLDELGAQIKATAEKAKAENPAELKKKIRELEAELKKQPVKQVEKSITEINNVPALTDAERKRLTKLIESGEKLFEKYGDIEFLMTSFRPEYLRMNQELQFFKDLLAGKLTPPTKFSPAAKPMLRLPVRVNNPMTAQLPRTVASADTSNGGDFQPDKCQRGCLSVLAAFPDGCSINKLALLAVYSVCNSFKTELSGLRQAGMICGGNTEIIKITERGRSLAQPIDLHPPGMDRVRFFINHRAFDKCQRSVMEALIDVDEGLTLEELAKKTNYAVCNSFKTELSGLRTAGVIVGRNTEAIKINPEMLE